MREYNGFRSAMLVTQQQGGSLVGFSCRLSGLVYVQGL